MVSIQPELWIDQAAAAVAFYESAFGARVLHQVGEGDEIVAQLAIGDAAFWVSSGGADGPRFSPGRSAARLAGPCWWLMIQTLCSRRRSRPAPLRLPRWPTSTAGVWAGSSIRSVMSGKSASRWASGRQPEGLRSYRQRVPGAAQQRRRSS